MKKIHIISIFQGYFKEVSILTFGNIISLLITLVGYPIITRLYSDTIFGEFAVFQSFLIILISMGTLQYDKAIVLIKKISNLHIFIQALFILLVSFAASLSLVIYTEIPKNLHIPLNKSLFWWLLIAVILGASNQIGQWYYLRTNQLKLLSVVKVVDRLFFQGAAILFAYFQWGYNHLVLAAITGQATIFTIAITKLRFIFSKIHFTEAAILLRKYKSFPYYSFPSGLVERISSQAPILLLPILTSEALTGQFSLAYRILSLPEAIIGAGIGQIFYKKIGNLIHHQQALTPELLRCWKLLLTIGAPVFLTLLLWGDDIFSLVFSESWQQSGEIVQMLSIMLLFMFVSTPTSSTFAAMNKQYYGLIFSLISLTSRFLSLYLGIRHGGFYFGLTSLVCAEILSIILYNTILLKEVKKWDSKIGNL
ncbi:oligosaccharide flippase family protein [Fulvivirga sediminis]|uniref:Oligosaccharide flippase family protein n=1 Tax=Fulvivirga sediminis TaxID=2803949 RepID=A0A937K1B8_9BACT|nr:oligosaccharide flippase family protein [Fulvivirga sediminis]MBL3656487.1 oligosaccharide flippase family protein [Fulvivirga sediminis]